MGRVVVKSGSRVQKVAEARAKLAQRYAADPDQVSRYQSRMARLAAVRRRGEAAKRWCILRCASRDTIELTDRLERAGFDAWTPINITTRRVTRARVKVEHLAAVMPSFVFADFDSAGDLFRLADAQSQDVPSFAVFHLRDRVPYIPDAQMASLRQFERDRAESHEREMGRGKSAQKPRGEAFAQGEEVRIPSGPFGGMTGIVERSDGRLTIVCFGSMPITIDTFILRSDVLELPPAQMGNAA